MQGGILLLLCLLALIIGSRARNSSNKPLSEKAIKNRLRIKKILKWASLIIISVLMILLIPGVIEQIMIARDTHFDTETFISIGIILFGFFTIYTIAQKLRKTEKQ